ncbi:hypothetical protein BIV57_16305 [Mangrovactinospora gilvigrisea]|uniref:HTH crp-type domain-containing protein n=1 Tax=Mangrovactinospora gilvigrisea TaxID=1428644 RepID=A0A1J7BCN7_9ACTN|nr:hypothetical protein BIV57_16305 [Mangrovactinospora gilvigrisea]
MPAPSPNQSAVIEAIRLAGELGRVEIAERTGLTPQSVSRIVRRLIDDGLVLETRPAPSAATGAGKPRTPLRLRPDAGRALGLHIDPDLLTAVVTDLEGRVLRRSHRAVSRRQPSAELVETLAAEARALLEASDPGPVLGAGIAVPGPVDPSAGVVLDPPLMRTWRDVPIRRLLTERLGLPVVMEKDATAATIGEHWIGKGARDADFAYLYLGAGVGAGLFLGGDVHRGLTANAGEFGRLVPDSDSDLPRPRQLARGALALVDLLDLDLVVLGGPALQHGYADYLAEVDRTLNTQAVARRIRPVRVERSVVETEAAAVGAASTVFHAAFAPRSRRAPRTGRGDPRE